MLGDPMTDLSHRAGSGLFPHGARPLLRPGHGQDSGQRIGTRQARRRRKHQDRLHRRSARMPRAWCRATSATISEIKLKGETVGQLSKRTLAYNTGFTLPPGTYTLKFLARENADRQDGDLRNQIRGSRPDHRR